jgi:SAM-dependent methyltransferase
MSETPAPSSPPAARGEWWRELYDDLLADVLLERASQAEVERTLAFLADALSVAPGARLFDQCCGIGSLAVPLAARGYDVVGVDLAPRYIARAQAAAAAAGVTGAWHAADAFAFVPAPVCDGAFNWWTSFGYARGDADNARMLARAFEALAPGGRFALDFMNVPGVLRGFRPRVVTERDTPRGRVTLTRTSRYDAATGLLHKKWHYRLATGQEIAHPSTVRAYTPPELVRLLGAAGFAQVRLVGDVDGSPLTLASPRCIAVATRPA